jgi:hypothetical protein
MLYHPVLVFHLVMIWVVREILWNHSMELLVVLVPWVLRGHFGTNAAVCFIRRNNFEVALEGLLVKALIGINLANLPIHGIQLRSKHQDNYV